MAISNHRLISMEGDQVTFRWKNYAHGSRKRGYPPMNSCADTSCMCYHAALYAFNYRTFNLFGVYMYGHDNNLLPVAR